MKDKFICDIKVKIEIVMDLDLDTFSLIKEVAENEDLTPSGYIERELKRTIKKLKKDSERICPHHLEKLGETINLDHEGKCPECYMG